MTEVAAKRTAGAARVLVVDDNEPNRDLLSRRLRRSGYEVDAVETGAEALEACARAAYDAVLLDVMMPGMSGIEVLRRLRETSKKTELPVIMTTAKGESADVVDALASGANDYVTKPIDFAVLLARLDTQLAMKAESAARVAPVIDATLGISPGTVIDERYEVLSKLGEGGFAVVYRARQLSTGQEVALKHALPELVRGDTDHVHLERFKREMTLIGQLDHPHVVRLVDSGSIKLRRSYWGGGPRSQRTRSDGEPPVSAAPSHTQRKSRDEGTIEADVPYIVLELLRGESLAALIARDAPLAPARAVNLVLPVVSALAAAHERGVVHRDVKPSNVMLVDGPHGEVVPKVLDFGIAKLTEPDLDGAALTVSEALIGTPQYMAPEQVTGGKEVDARVDQFAAAALLYEALTGRSPYEGKGFYELLIKVARADFPRLATIRPDLPADLVAVVDRALSESRDDRFESMVAFGRALAPHADPEVAAAHARAFEHDPRPPGAESARVLAPARVPRDVIAVATADTLEAPAHLVRPALEASTPSNAPSSPARDASRVPWGWIALTVVLVIALCASLLR